MRSAHFSNKMMDLAETIDLDAAQLTGADGPITDEVDRRSSSALSGSDWMDKPLQNAGR
jgi:hypothetical protein